MHAPASDPIVVSGHGEGEPDRDGEVLAAVGVPGAPPYWVRRRDEGHDGLYFPGPDARAAHLAHEER